MSPLDEALPAAFELPVAADDALLLELPLLELPLEHPAASSPAASRPTANRVPVLRCDLRKGLLLLEPSRRCRSAL
jgi:hypothetical protein